MDNLSNLISNLRNAGLARRYFVTVPRTRLNIKILAILYSEGFIKGYTILDTKQVKVFPVYLNDGLSLVGSLKRVSTPGRRQYVTSRYLIRYYSGKFCLLSTSKGLLLGSEAIMHKVGGELLFERFYYL